MHPTFHLGPLDFPAYFTLLTIGYLLAVLLAWKETFRIPGVDPAKFLDLSILLLIAGLIGARILHVLADDVLADYIHLCTDPTLVQGKFLPHSGLCVSDQQCVDLKLGEICNFNAGTCHPGRDCWRWIKFWYGGLAFYGGLILAAGVGVLFMLRNRQRLEIRQVVDLAGFGIPLGLVFGRSGCWFAGCCFGSHSDGPLAVSFPKFSPAWERHLELKEITRAASESLPVHATQLWHVFSNLAIFLFCFYLFKRRRRFPGIVLGWFLVLYAVSRFVIEFWRDDHRGVWWGGALSTSQLLGIPVLLIGIGLLWWFAKHPRPDLLEERPQQGTPPPVSKGPGEEPGESP